jgi:O-antigen/teichoic acid export membrane protein
MITDLKRTFQKTSVYAIGNVTTKLIGLVLIPLYTDAKYFSVADFGALGILEITSQVLVAILGLSLAQSLTRWFWDANFVDKQKSVFFTTLAALSVFSIIAILVMLPLSDSISQLLFQNDNYGYIIKLVLVATICQVVTNHIFALVRLQEKASLFSAVNILKLLITLILTVYLVIYQNKKLDGVFEAQAIGSVFTLLILIPFAFKNSEWKFEATLLKEMLLFSYPLIIASISGVFFSVIDRFFINYMKGLEDVGIFNLGFKLSSTLNVVVITSIQLALTPVMMKKMNDKSNKRFYSKIMTYISFVLMFCIVVLSLFSLEGIKLFVNNPIYWNSVFVVSILSVGAMFSMLKDQAIIGLHITKKTKITGTIIVISTLINIVFNILLIPRFGVYGAALSTTLAQVAFFWFVYSRAQKEYYIPYEMNKIFMLIGTGLIIITAGLLINPMVGWIRIPLKLLFISVYFIALYFLKFFDPIEVENIKKIVSAWKSPKDFNSNLKRLIGI